MNAHDQEVIVMKELASELQQEVEVAQAVDTDLQEFTSKWASTNHRIGQ